MDQQRPDDAELVAEVLAGNREAFAQLYDRHAMMVRAVALAVSGDWAAVDDMVQESFLRAYRKLATIREPAIFGRWIVGIARQVARERRRSKRRDRLESGFASSLDSVSLARVECESIDHEQIAFVMSGMAELPERERLAIHLYFLDDQNAGQAAVQLGLSRSGFYALLQRAVGHLPRDCSSAGPKARKRGDANMSCFSHAQLVEFALKQSGSDSILTHLGECPACRTAHNDASRIFEQLSIAHAELKGSHAIARIRLLEQLADVATSNPTAPKRKWFAHRLERFTFAQRIAATGLGLATLLGMGLVILVIANSVAPLSAMERMARQLREVRSYSYRLSRTNTSKPGSDKHPLIVQRSDLTSWLAPSSSQFDTFGSLVAETTIVHTKGTAPDATNTQVTVHIKESYPAGQPGIIIDHVARTYFRTPPARSDEVPEDSPIRMLQFVREGSYEVVSELGSKLVGITQARGYIVAIMPGSPFSTVNALEVWINPATNLPLEFSYQAENEWQTEEFRVTDCQWNIALDAKWFEAMPPIGYKEIPAASVP